MTGFNDVVDLLDGLVVGRTVRKHGPFWRGKTRDDFVALKVFGKPVVDIGNPAGSNIVLALKGDVPFGADQPGAPDTAVFSRMPSGGPAAGPNVIATIEAWIAAGCPEQGPAIALAGANSAAAISDNDHISYWRAFDDFFLYRASDDVSEKVGTFMSTMTTPWKMLVHGTSTEAAWNAIRARPDIVAATEVIRDNHERIMAEHYGTPLDAAAVLDGHWKFGGDLLPSDPQSSGAHQHTMNGPSDWANWAPFIDSVLRDDPADPFSLMVARGWHVGIVADGLLRSSPRRRIAIPDFQRNDPDLKARVVAHYQSLDGPELRAAMATRMLRSGII
jgi:hypothetical protein